MIKKLASFLIGHLISKESYSMEVARLKVSYFYVRLIKTSRLLFLSFLGMGICLSFILGSLILFHVTLFLYPPLTPEAKMWIGFLCSAVYLLVAIVTLSSVFSEDRWMKIFHAEKLLNDLNNSSEESSTEHETTNRN